MSDHSRESKEQQQQWHRNWYRRRVQNKPEILYQRSLRAKAYRWQKRRARAELKRQLLLSLAATGP